MTVDTRYLLLFRRWWSVDSRDMTIDYITRLLHNTFSYLDNNNDRY